MATAYGDRVRMRREMHLLSQRALAAAVGVTQPMISAIESGRRAPAEPLRTLLDERLAIRPSLALERRRADVAAAVRRHGGTSASVTGSVARGEDDVRSDLDLLVSFEGDRDIVDLLALEDELADLLTVPVDVISAGSTGGDRDDGPARGSPAVTDEKRAHRLADLASFAAEAAYITERGRDAYVAPTLEGALLRNAGERILIKVATVVERLDEEYRNEHPDVDWVAITRMRNLVAHHDDKINDDLMWRALERRVPELVRQLGLS